MDYFGGIEVNKLADAPARQQVGIKGRGTPDDGLLPSGLCHYPARVSAPCLCGVLGLSVRDPPGRLVSVLLTST